MTLTVGSLCSGIGGLDLGLERAGMRVIWQSEIDPYGCQVLKKHWPHVPNLGDIKAVDWSSVERPDLICGGYPCQPFSYAGRRAGTDDPRHLWPWIAECLRLVRPRWALFENVAGHLSLGFDTVLADLATLGFDVEWELLPAAAFGAPHLRYRVLVVARAHRPERWQDDDRRRRGSEGRDGQGQAASGPRLRRESLADPRIDPLGPGLCADEPAELRRRRSSDSRGPLDDADGGRHWSPDRSVFPRRRSPELSSWWAVEPDVGRVAYGVPSRVDRLRCLGNAVVPQVAEWIGRRILEAAA